MNHPLDPQHKRWVEGYAAKAHRRLQAAGCSTLQVEDVRQECWIAWCKARDTFDPAAGASFGGYLWRGMELHLKRWRAAQIETSFRHVMGEKAVLVAESELDPLDMEGALERREKRERALGRMSSTTRRVVALIAEPPAWLLEEYKAMRAKVQWCRKRGFLTREWSELRLVSDALGLTPGEMRRVEDEMSRLAAAVR